MSEAGEAAASFFDVAASSHARSSAFSVVLLLGGLSEVSFGGGGARLSQLPSLLLVFVEAGATRRHPLDCSASACFLASSWAAARAWRHSATRVPSREKAERTLLGAGSLEVFVCS